jgi:hypothetical protein
MFHICRINNKKGVCCATRTMSAELVEILESTDFNLLVIST